MNWKSIIIIVVAAALVIYAVYSTVQKLRGRSKGSSCCGSKEVVTKKVKDQDPSHYPYRYRLKVEGMKCSNCAANVENALNATEGVWAQVNLSRGEAQVRSKETHTREDFEQALSKTAYKVTEFATAADLHQEGPQTPKKEEM